MRNGSGLAILLLITQRVASLSGRLGLMGVLPAHRATPWPPAGQRCQSPRYTSWTLPPVAHDLRHAFPKASIRATAGEAHALIPLFEALGKHPLTLSLYVRSFT